MTNRTRLARRIFAFTGFKRGCPLSNMALEAVLRRSKIDVTTHGFRSSFRDWAGDRTAVARDVAEVALCTSVPKKAQGNVTPLRPINKA